MTSAVQGAGVHVMTPLSGSGAAIAIVQLDATSAANLDAALAQMKLGKLETGGVKLCVLPGGDRGLAVRWSPTCAQLFPHGGRLVLDAMRRALGELGFDMRDEPSEDPRTAHREAQDLVEACALDTIARASSPRAIEVILDHASRWRGVEAHEAPTPEHDRLLHRLIEPSIVVLAGPPNAGKSTLVNALARRSVSIVSRTPGTTRDHVGVLLEVDGLVVRCLDLPGFTPESLDPIERHAIELASLALEQADLILHCLAPDVRAADLEAPRAARVIRLATKADLASRPRACDLAVSAQTGQGLTDLSGLIRRALVPDQALVSNRLWRFHPRLPIRSAPGSSRRASPPR